MVARIQEQLRDELALAKTDTEHPARFHRFLEPRLATDEVEALLLYVQTLERDLIAATVERVGRLKSMSDTLHAVERERDDLLEKAERLQVTWEKVKELEERLTAARRERDEVYAVNAANANDRARRLATALQRVLQRPRWLSIGSHENTAEIRISRNAYDAAAELACKELGIGLPEPERMTKDEFKDYIRTGRRVPKHLPGSTVHAEAVAELVEEGVLTPADAGVANRFIDAVAEASGEAPQ